MKKCATLVLTIVFLASTQNAKAIEGGESAIGKNVVKIEFLNSGGGTGICSGAVLNQNLILTAKHCLGLSNSNSKGNAISATVYYPGAEIQDIKFGKAKVVDVFTTNGLKAGAGEGEMGFDIAFLIIDKNFPLPANQKLPTFDLIEKWKNNRNIAYSYGYGFLANGTTPNFPKRLAQNFADSTVQSTNQIILKHPTRESFICGGDSGGPTFVEEDGFEYLIGPMSGTTLDSCKRESIPIPATTLVTNLINFMDLYNLSLKRIDQMRAISNFAITCIKGKQSKKIIGRNPKCPTGFTKK